MKNRGADLNFEFNRDFDAALRMDFHDLPIAVVFAAGPYVRRRDFWEQQRRAKRIGREIEMVQMMIDRMKDMNDEERALRYDDVKKAFEAGFCQPDSVLVGILRVAEDDEFCVMQFPEGTGVLLDREGCYRAVRSGRRSRL